MYLSRRQVLRGVGSLIALPALESLGFRRNERGWPFETLRFYEHRLWCHQGNMVS